MPNLAPNLTLLTAPTNPSPVTAIPSMQIITLLFIGWVLSADWQTVTVPTFLSLDCLQAFFRLGCFTMSWSFVQSVVAD